MVLPIGNIALNYQHDSLHCYCMVVPQRWWHLWNRRCLGTPDCKKTRVACVFRFSDVVVKLIPVIDTVAFLVMIADQHVVCLVCPDNSKLGDTMPLPNPTPRAEVWL